MTQPSPVRPRARTRTRVRRSVAMLAAVLGAGLPFVAGAAVYELPPPGNDLVGHETWVTVRKGETLRLLAEAHSVGYDELLQANPGIDPERPGTGTPVLLPTRYVLPSPRRGIVVNLAERRLYWFPPGTGTVETYPVSVGRDGLDTPTIVAQVTDKLLHPSWYPGPAAQQDRIDAGLRPWPNVVPPGPENPLGPRAFKLDIPEILLHGTNEPGAMGSPVTHGCIRLAHDDLARLFEAVPRGTPVRIINRRYKVGWQNGVLYMEAHLPRPTPEAVPEVQDALAEAQDARPGYALDWPEAMTLLVESPGTPRPLWPRATARAAAPAY